MLSIAVESSLEVSEIGMYTIFCRIYDVATEKASYFDEILFF